MSSKISLGIIGIGRVGASVAASILFMGCTRELLLYDLNQSLAEGEAMDLSHGSSFYPAATVRSVSLEEMLTTNAIVITAGRNGRPEESRLDLLKDNAKIVRSIAQQLKNYPGIVVMLSNPVDVLTYEFQQASGLPPERVIGTGTMLDTARLRQVLAQELDLDPHSIHAQVVGEHGDSEIVLWSCATLGGIALREWSGWSIEKEERIAKTVRTAAYDIIQRKGATNHAIGLVAATLLKWLLRGERRILTVSRVQTGAFGLEDLALSLPTIVSLDGAVQVLEPEMNTQEKQSLLDSANVIRQAIASISEIGI